MNKLSYVKLLLAVRVVLGVILLYAGIAKSIDTQSFADAIYAFRILPSVLINPMAITLPILEITLGCMLIAGRAERLTLLAVSLLLAVFSLVLGQALIRGLNIDCGCFGPEKGSLFGSVFSLSRDAVMFAGSILLYVKSKSEQL
jgi:putative oxidoreductase